MKKSQMYSFLDLQNGRWDFLISGNIKGYRFRVISQGTEKCTYTIEACARGGARACTTVISIRRSPVRRHTHTRIYVHTHVHIQAPRHKNINACRPPPACCWLHAPLKPYSSVSLSRRNPTSSLRYFLVHPSYESLSECVNVARGCDSSLPRPKVSRPTRFVSIHSRLTNPVEIICLDVHNRFFSLSCNRYFVTTLHRKWIYNRFWCIIA